MLSTGTLMKQKLHIENVDSKFLFLKKGLKMGWICKNAQLVHFGQTTPLNPKAVDHS
jgi:hypothetical protein